MNKKGKLLIVLVILLVGCTTKNNNIKKNQNDKKVDNQEELKTYCKVGETLNSCGIKYMNYGGGKIKVSESQVSMSCENEISLNQKQIHTVINSDEDSYQNKNEFVVNSNIGNRFTIDEKMQIEDEVYKIINQMNLPQKIEIIDNDIYADKEKIELLKGVYRFSDGEQESSYYTEYGTVILHYLKSDKDEYEMIFDGNNLIIQLLLELPDLGYDNISVNVLYD